MLLTTARPDKLIHISILTSVKTKEGFTVSHFALSNDIKIVL
jgi:hypothetical protein